MVHPAVALDLGARPVAPTFVSLNSNAFDANITNASARLVYPTRLEGLELEECLNQIATTNLTLLLPPGYSDRWNMLLDDWATQTQFYTGFDGCYDDPTRRVDVHDQMAQGLVDLGVGTGNDDDASMMTQASDPAGLVPLKSLGPIPLIDPRIAERGATTNVFVRSDEELKLAYPLPEPVDWGSKWGSWDDQMHTDRLKFVSEALKLRLRLVQFLQFIEYNHGDLDKVNAKIAVQCVFGDKMNDLTKSQKNYTGMLWEWVRLSGWKSDHVNKYCSPAPPLDPPLTGTTSRPVVVPPSASWSEAQSSGHAPKLPEAVQVPVQPKRKEAGLAIAPACTAVKSLPTKKLKVVLNVIREVVDSLDGSLKRLKVETGVIREHVRASEQETVKPEVPDDSRVDAHTVPGRVGPGTSEDRPGCIDVKIEPSVRVQAKAEPRDSDDDGNVNRTPARPICNPIITQGRYRCSAEEWLGREKPTPKATASRGHLPVKSEPECETPPMAVGDKTDFPEYNKRPPLKCPSKSGLAVSSNPATSVTYRDVPPPACLDGPPTKSDERRESGDPTARHFEPRPVGQEKGYSRGEGWKQPIWHDRREKFLPSLPCRLKLCKFSFIPGGCRQLDRCPCFHSAEEHKQALSRLKKKWCPAHWGQGPPCEFGDRCHFVHDSEEWSWFQ